MTDRELMQEAWEALNLVLAPFPVDDQRCMRVAKKLQERLAQPQRTHWEGCEEVHPECRKPEPVACPYCKSSATLGAVYYDQNCVGCVKRMTSSPQRKPLTDEEIEDLYFDKFSMGELKAFARAIEAAHGIGEQA
jgi:hypothetical protein